ncbi:MAG: ABC transporter ATP-binding protein [Rhodospirillaceae bacterium]|nr:ABC transporter ATP-binding protein [Rhodospirillaceae bacterium]
MVGRPRGRDGRALGQVGDREVADREAAGHEAAGQPAAGGPVSPAPPGSPHLALAGIERHFGATAALAGIDLAARPGEFLTLLGPSGSGKTTLLKTIAGFEPPDRGTIALAGRDITALAPAKRNIGMVFQNYALFPHMNAAGNVGFPLAMRGLGRQAVADKVSATLALVGLAGYEERLPRQLSGGQQQRVALARAIVFDPSLLLLDEPFGALDRKLRAQMQLEIRRLQRRLAVTTLFVTHDQEEALALSDRVAVMNEGRIVQLGSPEDLYFRPASRFVAEFVGDANVFRGRAGLINTGVVEVKLETGAPMRASIVAGDHSVHYGADLALIVRPERPHLLAPGDTAENRATGTIAEAAFLGEAVRYRVALDGGGEMQLRWPAGGRAMAPGTPVELGWAAVDMIAVRW